MSEIAAIGSLTRAAAVFLAAIILATAPSSGALAAASKAGKPAPSEKSEATPEKIQELMVLLADPKVRDWLEQESKAEVAQAVVDAIVGLRLHPISLQDPVSLQEEQR